ncbi:cytokinesis protein 3 [Pestalotiopsis sp. 9143b]|nr:cytokinesis protein 3 [Pestalotiopsis sp. 9143b]
MPAVPPLPMRFPCWCRAVYSWGGESQRDLGFVEGDLIECLNAGDGSWWTGRLRRNKTVGIFPSNFVEVLPENFRPVSRSTSPLTSSNTPSPSASTPQKTKSKPFRKPFEAYAKAPHYTTAKQPEVIRDMPQRQNSHNSFQEPERQSSRNSFQESQRHNSRNSFQESQRHNSRNSFQEPPSRTHRQNSHAAIYQQSNVIDEISRRPSAPEMHEYGSRAPSPAPSMSYGQAYAQRGYSPAPSVFPHAYSMRAPSPAPPLQMSFFGGRAASPQPPPSPMQYGSRAPSPAPSLSFTPYRPGAERAQDSPPPPAPPPHRHQAPLSRGPSDASYDARPHTPRAPSPAPPSPGGDGFTPSPLREAMDGVMEQLDALGINHESQSPETPLDPWSPESFDMIHHRSKRKTQTQMRPQTSMGVALQDEGYETRSGGSSAENTFHSSSYRDDRQQPTQLSNYVERMETRLKKMHQHSSSMSVLEDSHDMGPPPPPKKNGFDRPRSAMDESERRVRKPKSTYDMSRQALNRTATTKTTSTEATNSSSNTQSTNHSLMSGVSAGGISATSAGSLARKNRNRAQSALGFRTADEALIPEERPTTPFSGVSYHPSHSTSQFRSQSQAGFHDDGIASIGGLVSPSAAKPKKSNFIKRILEATKTGVASGRSTIAGVSTSASSSPVRPSVMTAISGGPSSTNLSRDLAARDMGLSAGVDWVQVRRDVNRSNTLSKNERMERRDRCQMLDYPAIDPVEELYESIEGDEDAEGLPVRNPTDYQGINWSQVDKNSRFIKSLPHMTTAITLATTYVCRPYRSEVQRLRAIFIWVAEMINWEEDFEGEVDTRRVITTKRGCAEEYAALVHEMCAAVGIQSEVVRGYLKTPGEVPETTIMPRPNHWWNAVLVDEEWRIIDCCLASASNPRRALYSSSHNTNADGWWFLTRPTEICWTHVPEHHAQQHICPPVPHDVLLNLPGACPPYFKNNLAMVDFNTALTRIEDLEMVHIKFNVPADVEVAAEVEVRAYSRDNDGDFFESGDVIKKRALAQAEWFNGDKRYTVKALLPGDEGAGVLKVYAGKRGLMHSIKDIPHPLAFALPIIHTGENPPYEFVTRHPTPHAQRHDIYVVQPQCQKLALNNTFVFAIRQHPSTAAGSPSSNPGGTSPIPFMRPGSAMSMASSLPSNASSSGYGGGPINGKKPAKLAIQTPGGKILRLMRKEERRGIGAGSRIGGEEEPSDGGSWETIIKCSERGVWRGLVLADRTAKWCVFAEWICIG